MTRLDLEAVKAAVARIFPITVEMTDTHANLYFNESRTQAMTMETHEWHVLSDAVPALISEVEALREALRRVAHPMATFAGPQCCADTFADACELFSDIARAVLPETETEEK